MAFLFNAQNLYADDFPKENRVELQLHNGDKLTGTLLNRADGKIFFRSELLGDLILKESDAAVINLPDTPVEVLAGLPTEDGPPKEKKPPKDKPEKPVAVQKPSAKTQPKPKPAPAVAETKPPSIPAAQKKPANPWKGKVEFGFQQQDGRTSTVSYQLRAEAEKKSNRNTYRATSRFLYGEQNGTTNAERMEGSFRWRYELGASKYFAQSQTSYYQDGKANINHNLEQNLGMGYRLFEKPKHVLNVGAGLTEQYREQGGNPNHTTTVTLGEFFQDYTFKASNRISFLQNSAIQYWPGLRPGASASTGDQTMKLRFNATLQGKISNNVSMNVRYEYEYDNSIVKSSDQTITRIISSIGYAF